MKIRNNSYPGPEFSKTVKIKHHVDRFAFNFSFLNKREGLEKIPESNVKLSIHPDFKSSKRYDECDDDFWVFRLGNLGRVIGKINENIFYIMSIDASFDQYNHGS